MSTTSTETFGTQLRCEQCGTSAAADQRYCLNCGAHINEAPDPVAVYFSEASAARTRVAAAVARGAAAKQSRRMPRVSAALAIVLVVIALLIGIAIGHSSSSSSSAESGTTAKVTTTSSAKTTFTAGSVTKKTGKSYRQQENSLPTTVTP